MSGFRRSSCFVNISGRPRTPPKSTGLLYRLLYGGAVRTGKSGNAAPVPSGTISPVREQDAERIAIDIYKRADAIGERITLGLVERHIANCWPTHSAAAAAAVRRRER